MNSPSALLDTGPLVAYLSPRDSHHVWAREAMFRLRPPLITTEPVLTEACFLLSRTAHGVDLVFDMLAREVLVVGLNITGEARTLRRLVSKYANVPMSLADASLVRLAELYGSAPVLTLDSDFRFYRRHGRQAISLIAPFGR